MILSKIGLYLKPDFCFAIKHNSEVNEGKKNHLSGALINFTFTGPNCV